MKRKFASRAAIAAIVGLAFGSVNVRAAEKDIVDTAVGAGQFKTLAAALTAAGLVETLKGPGPFTVFAPTDDAFAKLPAGTVKTLLKPENKEKLTAILTYHVVPGKLMAADVVKFDEAKTVNGAMVDVCRLYTSDAVDDPTTGYFGCRSRLYMNIILCSTFLTHHSIYHHQYYHSII